MRLWHKVTLGIVCTLLLLIGAGWFWLTGPERELAKNPFMNTISQKTTKWDSRVDLMSEPLSVGLGFVDVETQLISAGFTELDGPVMRTSWITNESDPLNDNLKQEGEIVFKRGHGTFVCDVDYIVFLKFDQSNSLVSAEGISRGAACL